VLEAYGLEVGQTPIYEVHEMAARYVADLRKIQPVGPYQIGGYSVGGTVAIEMAQQLYAANEEVSVLVLFDVPPPYGDGRPYSEEEGQAILHEFLVRRALQLGSAPEEAQSMTIDEVVEVNLSREKELFAGHTPEQYLQLYRVIGANIYVQRRYPPQIYPGRISLFRGNAPSSFEDDYGWSRFALGGVDVYHFDVKHDLIIDEENLPQLAPQLSSCFAKSAAYQAQSPLSAVIPSAAG
jgi:thioesterase domain-containing protein